MEIRNQVSVPFHETSNINRGANTKPIERIMPELVSMATFVDRLPLETSDSIVDRSSLETSIILASPDKRKEIISHLNELRRVSAGNPLGELLDRKLPDVKKEGQQNNGVERLLELLFSLLMILGKANTARNAAATKFGAIALDQAAAAGAKAVSAAVANLGGAVGGMALGVVAAGVGFKQFSKGTNGQIRNSSINGREVSQLRAQNASAKNALNRPAVPTITGPQRSLQKLESNSKELAPQKNAPTLSTEERPVLSQTALRTEAKIGGAKGQIRNTSPGGQEPSEITAQNVSTNNAPNPPISPGVSSPQKSVQKLESNGKELELQKNSPDLSTEERAVLSQTMLRTEAKISAKELASQINSQKFGRAQFAGQTVATFAQPLSAIGQASAGVQASQFQAASKIADAQGAIASTIQRSEEQATQRSIDLIARTFSQILATSEQNRTTVESLGRSIKA